jgi:predicted MPP superfamily phosphohydrolase
VLFAPSGIIEKRCKQVMKMRTVKILAVLALLLLAAGAFGWWQNNGLTVAKVEYMNAEIPAEFRDYRIVQVSDLHNKEFGRGNGRLLDKLRDLRPDIIVVTGDLIDSSNTNMDVAVSCVEQMADIAPVCFVSGNHERNFGQYATLKGELLAAGAQVLDNSGFILEREGEQIALLGMADPAFLGSDSDFALELAALADAYQGMFTILLSHRPEKMSVYAACDIDLVFAGHAHGGQFRLPLLGGLVAPNQGLFPKYTRGVYELEDTSMVVSRGLGNSIIPLRLFNRPELVLVVLAGE